MDQAMPFSFMGDEALSLITIFLLLIAASLYIMGLMQGKQGYYLYITGCIVHLLSILQRGMTIGSLPLAEKHDNISFVALVMAIGYLYLQKKKDAGDLGLIALPLISITLLISAAYPPINTISPFMRSVWFYLYIFFYFLAYGFFGLAFCIGLLFLYRGSSSLELLQYKGILYGWVLLSLGLVAGSIWFYFAYGTYWRWTSRELWTTLLWFYYGLYLHARLMKGLRGSPAAIIGNIGFLVALFTYFGVGTVIPSPPTQF